MKKAEVLIHIGTPKTGSTSLQKAFYSYNKLMRKEKIFYPLTRSGRRYGNELNELLIDECAGKLLSSSKLLQESYKKNLEDYVEKVKREFVDGRYKKCLYQKNVYSLNQEPQLRRFIKKSFFQITMNYTMQKYYV